MGIFNNVIAENSNQQMNQQAYQDNESSNDSQNHQMNFKNDNRYRRWGRAHQRVQYIQKQQQQSNNQNWDMQQNPQQTKVKYG